MKYSADDIVCHNWPDEVKISKNRWAYEWNIIFKEPVSEELDLEESSHNLSYQGYQVSPIKDDNRHFRFKVITNYSRRDEDFLFCNIYKMLEEIDIVFGEIDIIQGQSRNLWDPWLTRDKYPNNDYKLSRIIAHSLEVGLRVSLDKGFSFFGTDEVNDLLFSGAKVVSIKPGGAITQELDKDAEGRKFALTGFSIIVYLERREPGITVR